MGRRTRYLRHGRGAQALRQLMLLRLLCGSGWLSMREICDEMYGRALRTAYRDVEQLLAVGVPIETREVEDDTGRRTELRMRWRSLEEWFRE